MGADIGDVDNDGLLDIIVATFQWLPNTLTLWDNRCTQHHAIWDYFPHSRRGERVSVVGEERPSA